MNLGFFSFCGGRGGHTMRDLRFLTRGQPRTTALEAQNLNHGTSREIPKLDFISNQVDFQA